MVNLDRKNEKFLFITYQNLQDRIGKVVNIMKNIV